MAATGIAPAPDQSAANTSPAPAALVPFTRASREHTELFFDSGNVLAGVELPPTDIPAYGFLRGVIVDVTITSATNAATVATQEDAPFNVILSQGINDVNSTPVNGPYPGITAYIADKLSGSRGPLDPKLIVGYTPILTGSGANAGSGHFQYRIPIEAIARTGLGALANANSSTTYKMRCSINSLANIFTTPPTNAPTFRVKYYLEAWSVPADHDWRGRPQQQLPPGNGTTNYWSRYLFSNLAVGGNTIRLPRVGNYLRNIVLIFRTAAVNGRAAAEAAGLPDPINIFVDTRLWHQQNPMLARRYEAERCGTVSTVMDAAGAPLNGVVFFDGMHEFTGRLGMETADGWLPTLQSTRLEIQCVSAFAGSVEILTNDVAPPASAAM